MRKTVLAAFVLGPSLALASGYSLPNPHPRDLAVCASGVAAQSDASAAFTLPAALARIQGPSIRLGGGGVTVGVKWTDPTPGATLPPFTSFLPPTPAPPEPGTASVNRQLTGFPTIALSYGGKIPAWGDRGWGVGASLQPFGGTELKWPADWAGRYRVIQVDRKVFSATLGAGIELLPQVRVGGGVIYYYTMETFKIDLWQEGVGATGTPTAGYPDAQAKLGKLDGGSFSYDLSLELDPVKGVPLTLAFDYKHKATQDLSGALAWSNLSPVLAAAPGQVTTANHASQDLTIPNTMNFAAAYRVAPPVLVMATFTLDRWVVYDADAFTGNNGAMVVIPRHYGNGQTYRGGVAWDALEMLTVRAGVQRDVSGLDKTVYHPSLPDASSWGGSLGFTWKFAQAFSVDAAGFYAKFDKVTVPSSAVGREPGPPPLGAGLLPTGTFRGSYETDAWVFSASVNWHPRAM